MRPRARSASRRSHIVARALIVVMAISLLMVPSHLNLVNTAAVASRAIFAASPSAVLRAIREGNSSERAARVKADVRRHFGAMPLAFEVNRGQAGADVQYLAHGQGYELLLGTGAVVLRTDGGTVSTLRFGDTVRPVGEVPLPGVVNYFVGGPGVQAPLGVHTFAAVRYPDVYPNVDLTFYGNARAPEYDWNLRPGGDPRSISMLASGAALDASGNLVLAGGIVWTRPAIYQRVGTARVRIAGGYALHGMTITFRVGRYDHSRPLVIDPRLQYNTYLGGSGSDQSYTIAVDASGNAYVGGQTTSVDFPQCPGTATPTITNTPTVTSTPTDTATPTVTPTPKKNQSTSTPTPTFTPTSTPTDTATPLATSAVTCSSSGVPLLSTGDAGGSSYDAFVTKLNPTGTAFVWSDYLGGTNGNDFVYGIALDSLGNAYATGYTTSAYFPMCPRDTNEVDPASTAACPAAGTPMQDRFGGLNDAFVVKIKTDGTQLMYSSYLGGAGIDRGMGIAVDSAGDAYITGVTQSNRWFPVCPVAGTSTPTATPTSSVAAPTSTPTGTRTPTVTSTPTPAAVCATPASTPTPVVKGSLGSAKQNAYVAELNPGGTALVYGTYFGSKDLNNTDQGQWISLDSTGNAYIVGWTDASGPYNATPGTFPVCPADTAASRCATTPTTPTAYQPSNANPVAVVGTAALANRDAFVAELSSGAGSVKYSTFLGGTGEDEGAGISVDAAGDVSVMGNTASTDFPMLYPFQSTNAGGTDVFVSRLDLTQTGSAGLLFSSYLGGSGTDRAGLIGNPLTTDASNNVFITGYTNTDNGAATPPATLFPICPNYALPSPGTDGRCAYSLIHAGSQDYYGGGSNDAFLAKIVPGNPTATAEIVYSSYMGGSGDDRSNGIAVDGSDNAYITGYTNTNNFSATPPANYFPLCPENSTNDAMTMGQCLPTPGSQPAQANLGGGPSSSIYDAFIAKYNSSATLARLARLTVARHGSSAVVTWRLAARSGVLGFQIYGGKALLTPRVIPVHRSPNYRATVRWNGKGRLSLRVIFRDGRTEAYGTK